MKVFLALFLLAVAVDAFSLDALKQMLEEELERNEEKRQITLREYLDNLETPHPYYRSMSARDEVDCSSVCDPPPTVEQAKAGKTCASDKWVPEYTKNGQCECLTSYRCCGDKCPSGDLSSCWADGNEGLKYGIKEVDCCGCDVVKCLDCAPVEVASAVCPQHKNLSCFDYNPTAKKADVTKCFIAGCTEKASDAPADQVCDKTCMADSSKQSACKFPYNVCVPSKLIGTCSKRKVEANTPRLPISCYDNPTKVDDPAHGKYWNEGEGKCLKCQKWDYSKKSCAEKDKATAVADCHQFGESEFDRKCHEKRDKKDECECNDYTCIVNHNEPEAKFLEGEVCPKNHVKLSGTSICGSARDLCKPCPAVAEPACPWGVVLTSKDINGCEAKICQKPFIISAICEQNLFTYDPDTNQLTCKI